MEDRIAKAKSADIIIEGHGILSVYVDLSYGESSGQTIPLYNCQSEKGGEFIKAILDAFGVEKLSDIPGRHIVAKVHDGCIRGLAPMPTEYGKAFMFSDVMTG